MERVPVTNEFRADSYRGKWGDWEDGILSYGVSLAFKANPKLIQIVRCKPKLAKSGAGAHEVSISRNNFQSLVVKRNYPVAESLHVISCNVLSVYLIPAIKIGNQGRVLNYVEAVKSKP